MHKLYILRIHIYSKWYKSYSLFVFVNWKCILNILLFVLSTIRNRQLGTKPCSGTQKFCKYSQHSAYARSRAASISLLLSRARYQSANAIGPHVVVCSIHCPPCGRPHLSCWHLTFSTFTTCVHSANQLVSLLQFSAWAVEALGILWRFPV